MKCDATTTIRAIATCSAMIATGDACCARAMKKLSTAITRMPQATEASTAGHSGSNSTGIAKEIANTNFVTKVVIVAAQI